MEIVIYWDKKFEFGKNVYFFQNIKDDQYIFSKFTVCFNGKGGGQNVKLEKM